MSLPFKNQTRTEVTEGYKHPSLLRYGPRRETDLLWQSLVDVEPLRIVSDPVGHFWQSRDPLNGVKLPMGQVTHRSNPSAL